MSQGGSAHFMELVNVSIFVNVAITFTVLSGIGLSLYLYFSDGPVLSTDESIVEDGDSEK